MKIRIKVKARAREEKVEKAPDGGLIVKVKEAAEKGKANEAVREALARYFNVPKSTVTLLRGFSSQSKVIEIISGRRPW